jgi:hypothetical protein
MGKQRGSPTIDEGELAAKWQAWHRLYHRLNFFAEALEAIDAGDEVKAKESALKIAKLTGLKIVLPESLAARCVASGVTAS